MVMIRIWLLIFYCCSLIPSAYAQTLGFSLEAGKRKVQIPIEVYNNLVVVPVVLNETLPLKFIIDTGVRTAILTQKTFTDILNLTYSRKYSIAGPGGVKRVEAYVTNNVSLRLPGVIGKGHAVLVLEEDYLELRNYLGTDVHGILGYELFSRFIVEIDYGNKMMTLYAPNRFTPKRRFETVPITIEDTKPYVNVNVTLQDNTTINAKLLMDSGASHALLLDPATDERIKVPAHYVSSLIGRGLGGEITGKAGRVKSLGIGSFMIKDPIASFPDPNSYMDSLKHGSISRNGTLGGEILSRFTVIFNFPKEEVYLKRNHDFRKEFHYNLSGVTVKAKGSKLNVYVITKVRMQSPGAVADVREGDEIIAVNGITSQYLDLNIVNALLNRKPGKIVRLEIMRDGKRMKRRIILADQI
jgi:hypothetical protein